jgi:hypothetical protein
MRALGRDTFRIACCGMDLSRAAGEQFLRKMPNRCPGLRRSRMQLSHECSWILLMSAAAAAFGQKLRMRRETARSHPIAW